MINTHILQRITTPHQHRKGDAMAIFAAHNYANDGQLIMATVPRARQIGKDQP